MANSAMTSTWPRFVLERAEALRQSLAMPIAGFVTERRLPPEFNLSIDAYLLPLAVWLAEQRKDECCLVVGLCGGQGSGKSTLTAFLNLVWSAMGLRSTGFSLDDIYLTRAERLQLARTVHPLFATRGVPGTHDVPLGIETIDRLCTSSDTESVPIPWFDKSIDDRAPRQSWVRQHGPVDILVFEGWCVGAQPWQGNDEPINALERNEDPQGIWRNYINRALAGSYRDLFARMDTLVMLKVPDMQCVLAWRTQQEHELRSVSGGGMSDDQIERFVQHYERITRNLLREMPARADCVLELGRDHGIAGLRLNSH
ncbi:phosphoribulokinase [Microbulbifer guangxiensis]|uniref:phosphoribulokinase n=1 Tax=Microbulbifer guangxiensis TaxID=2904249 RepID=UPI001F46E24A|nr:phosphoribulokinase [Microbulbifer guangxiensis]